MGELSKLPNIGKVIEGQLEKVGISTIEELKALGSKNAWFKLWENDSSVCIDELYALEGAVQGKRWFALDDSTKNQLKDFYNQYQQ
ncbi:TfoX/Sxy family protein [Lactococcus formosensis]|jgi:TfoX C-terminal domain.|uniref:TfoX/Sxy family protein n=1 Tax=Lactococcus formosensis TaxID=1281486 RepID=A0A9X4SGY8_9LACT|nr:TfoX/Sxy family protein [Lactococcus formosensis]MCO7181085.1 TfoX/Sxy family protein [Lactococcus formosensis]MDG6111430.1 TfoX/Sxy family protein [Lactococcus formosensis]MDG6113689.1 TfoX/Sxy family protein [Lactococcus formosensis]MDG6115457.1 TfoX/Sxy family protein [Lactococcus formosensis]MDG6117693.1 TfoX/Sxy family protein [Lactococcus formosensis]